jgi:hypothetical protein
VLGEKENLEKCVRDLTTAMELDDDEKAKEYKQKIREAQVVVGWWCCAGGSGGW